MLRVARFPLVALLLLPGCISPHFYEGEPRPLSEVATFSSAAGGDGIRIAAVDGRTLYGVEAHVLPGVHRVLLHLRAEDLESFELDSFCSVSVDAQPGRVYVPVLRMDSSSTPAPNRRSGYGRRAEIVVGLVDSRSEEPLHRCDCVSRDPYECE